MPKKPEKIKAVIIIVLILLLVLLAFLGYIVYDSYFRGEADKTVNVGSSEEIPLWLSTETLPKLPRIIEIDFDNSLLNSSKFTNLKEFGDLPVEIGEIGRSNPFLPFATTTTEIDLEAGAVEETTNQEALE